MGRFNLDNYTEVKDRIPLFLADHPDGRIVTELVEVHWAQPAICVFRAELYRNHEEVGPMATGYAYERETGAVNKTSFVENCETSAVGRALANANYTGNGNRPSREEMAKVERVEQETQRLVDELEAVIAKHADDMTSDERIAADHALTTKDHARLAKGLAYLQEKFSE